jgi:competence protein ComEC
MHSILHGKPAVKILLPFMAGIACAGWIPLPWPCPALLLLLLTLAALIAFRRGAGRIFAVLTLSAFFCAGWLRLAFALQSVPPDDIRRMADLPAPVSLEGIISGPVEERNERQIFRLAVDSLWTEEGGFAAHGRTRIIYYDSLLQLRQGDMLVVKGMLRRPAGANNPGDFDYRAWLAGQGIHTQLSAAGPARLLLLDRDRDPLIQRALIRPIREHLLRSIDAGLDAEPRALLKALLVGVRSEIDDELRQEFSSLGVVHVLAVSGLHVGFVLAALLFAIELLRIPHRIRLPILLLALWIYVQVTGSAPPVVRAAVMAALLLAAPSLQRRLDPFHAMALAALILLLINPADLAAAGFQLSFAATLGILLIYRRLDRWAAGHIRHWRRQERSWRKGVLQLLMVSFAAQIATLPLTLWYFNTIPLYGLLANLAVVPLVSLTVLIGFTATLIGVAAPTVGYILLQCDWLLLTLLGGLVKWSAALPGAALEVATPSLLLLFLFYLGMAFILSWPQRRVMRIAALAFLLTANLWIWAKALQPREAMRLIFFDVGQGDAALVALPNRIHLLIDAGEANERIDCGKNLLLPWLRRQGIREVDAALITHSHSDHAGGVQTLLRKGRIRALYHPGGAAVPAFHALDSLAAACSVPVHSTTSGMDLFPARGAWLRILHSGGDFGEPWDENNGSITIRFQYGRRVFLFLADVEAPGESLLLPLGDFLRSDVVKVAHHGSPTASSEEMVEAAATRFAVISVGRGNRFHLPSPAVVARWQGSGARVLRTDESGAIVFHSDGDTLLCARP